MSDEEQEHEYHADTWPIIVTAPNVSFKAINTILLRMLYDTDPSVECPWIVLRDTRLAHELDSPTRPPVDEDLLAHNDFAGHSIPTIGAWMRDPATEARIQAQDISDGTCVVVDAKGLESGTAVVVQGNTIGEDHEWTGIPFAVRIPLEHIPSIVVNLWLANMNIEEFADEEAGPDADGVHRHGAWVVEGSEPVEDNEPREALARELRERDLLEDLPEYVDPTGTPRL